MDDDRFCRAAEPPALTKRPVTVAKVADAANFKDGDDAAAMKSANDARIPMRWCT